MVDGRWYPVAVMDWKLGVTPLIVEVISVALNVPMPLVSDGVSVGRQDHVGVWSLEVKCTVPV